jgi:hypothetical protein
LNRNYLKGEAGDRANVILAASVYNLAKLLKWFYCACHLENAIALLLCDCFSDAENIPVYR